jgi:hypothetical protein
MDIQKMTIIFGGIEVTSGVIIGYIMINQAINGPNRARYSFLGLIN